MPETDCVLATTEVVDLLAQHSVTLADLPPAALDPPFTNVALPPGGDGGGAMDVDSGSSDPAAAGSSGSSSSSTSATWYYGARGGSGGYLEHTFRAAAAALLGRAVPLGSVALQPGRNPDLREAELDPGDGRPPLRFAAVYGFRNIQGLMRKLKLGKCEYHYVEVMACPSGESLCERFFSTWLMAPLHQCYFLRVFVVLSFGSRGGGLAKAWGL